MITVTMFWDVGSAVSSQWQAAGDHVQASVSRSLQQQEQLQIAAASIDREIARDAKEVAARHYPDYDTTLKPSLESTDRENAQVGTEHLRWTEFTTSSY